MSSILLRLLLMACCCCSMFSYAQTVEGAQLADGAETADKPAASSGNAAADSQPARPVVNPPPAAAVNSLQGPQLAPGSGITATSPLTVLSGLAAIVLLIYGCAWLMKRMGAANVGAVAGMKIVAGVSVGPREKVLLVEVGGQQVLIGVAPGRVSHLQSFEQPVVETPENGAGAFSRKLKSLMAGQLPAGGDKP